MAKSRATITDVAQRAGVSIAAVSRAINGSTHISAEKLERINEAIEELGFRPTRAARNLRQRRTGNIALVVPSITNPFFPELVVSVHAEVHRRGYALLLVDADESETEAEAIRVIETRVADGVLLVGSPETLRSPAADVEVDFDVPSVAFDRAPRAWSTTVIQTENARGAAEVVTHLIDQGHTRIAHIEAPIGMGVGEDRARGYVDALRARGIEPDADLIVPGDFTEESGYDAALQLVASRREFSAIFSANDLMAIGAMAALKERGLGVPDDIAVAGFDGIHVARYVNPTLTTYAQPVREMAHRGVTLLLNAVEGVSRGQVSTHARRRRRTLRFAGELVVRESSGQQMTGDEGTELGDQVDRRGKHQSRRARVRTKSSVAR